LVECAFAPALYVLHQGGFSFGELINGFSNGGFRNWVWRKERGRCRIPESPNDYLLKQSIKQQAGDTNMKCMMMVKTDRNSETGRKYETGVPPDRD
jgi:hypothetical protein